MCQEQTNNYIIVKKIFVTQTIFIVRIILKVVYKYIFRGCKLPI